MKRETLSMLAKSARFTQRFEDRIGQLCREMTIKRVAELNNLSWDQVCRMEKSYMRRLLEIHPPSEHLRAIGIDEISIRKGHKKAAAIFRGGFFVQLNFLISLKKMHRPS